MPGVEVFAYAVHPVVEQFGAGWLAGGRMAMRFERPVYDGRMARVTATPEAEGLSIGLSCDDLICARGSAWATAPSPIQLTSALRPQPVPDRATRPTPDLTSLAVGRELRSSADLVDPVASTTYLADIREHHPAFASVIHPGLLLRRCNAILVDNVLLPPWVHVSSDIKFLVPGRVGQRIHAEARVLANYERKGHRFVDLGCMVIADDKAVVAEVLHTAIYRLRD